MGQNKSKPAMKYACMQSVLFYKSVILLFLLPRHSHMAEDRATAQGKRLLKHKNLYTLAVIVSLINTVKAMN